MTRPRFNRILLKVSGEALMGHGQFGIDPDATAALAKDETLREMLNASADLSRSRQDLAEHIGVFSVVLRDLLQLSEGDADIANVDIRQRLETLAQRANTEQWIRVAEFLRELELGLRANLNKQMLTDSLALVTSNLPDDRARN